MSIYSAAAVILLAAVGGIVGVLSWVAKDAVREGRAIKSANALRHC